MGAARTCAHRGASSAGWGLEQQLGVSFLSRVQQSPAEPDKPLLTLGTSLQLEVTILHNTCVRFSLIFCISDATNQGRTTRRKKGAFGCDTWNTGTLPGD